MPMISRSKNRRPFVAVWLSTRSTGAVAGKDGRTALSSGATISARAPRWTIGRSALLSCMAGIVAMNGARLGAQDYATDKPAAVPQISLPLTPEQKAALNAVDVRLAAVEA